MSRQEQHVQSLPYLTLDKNVRQVRMNPNVAPAIAPSAREAL
jgi:hypothetical protein